MPSLEILETIKSSRNPLIFILAAICHMNLDGIRSMKLTQLQPRYVLIIPSSDDAYAEMVKEMNQDDAEIGWSEYQEFKQVNRENPGYFDMVIPADTVEQAHIAVRDLVKDFLGKE